MGESKFKVKSGANMGKPKFKVKSKFKFISFFEEFPSRKTLAKARLISWSAKMYIAAPSLKEFQKKVSQVKKLVKSRNIREFIYWPTLRKVEGYWISPFSSRIGINRIFRELEGEMRRESRGKVPVMLDLELPTTQNPLLYFTQLPFFLANKRKIRSFLEGYPGEIYQCEYFPSGRISRILLRLLGLHYTFKKSTLKKEKIIKMLYSSMHQVPDELFREELRRGRERWGKRFAVGLGVLAPGVMGNEKSLTAAQLARDLKRCREAGMEEVVIYRLAGLDKKHLKVLRGVVKKHPP